MDFIANFIDDMRAKGCAPADAAGITADDRRHRFKLEGDRGRVENGSYQLRVDGDFAVGWFRSFRQGITHKFSSRSKTAWTDEEKAAWKAKVEAARQEQAERIKSEHEKAIKTAAWIWKRSSAVYSHEYLDRKMARANGARFYKGALVIPVYVDGKISTLQFIGPDGAKKFITGGALEGGYFPIVDKGEDLSTFVVCEGFATADAIRQSLGLPVVVAFNASNLKPAVKVLRKKYPNSRIIIAADNDAFTFIQKHRPQDVDLNEISGDDPRWETWRTAEFLENPGVKAAEQAAIAIGGASVIWPEFESQDVSGRPTDFNDAFVLYGADRIKERFASALAQKEEVPSDHGGSSEYSSYQEGGHSDPHPVDDVQAPGATTRTDGDFGMRFRILGYNDKKYYYFPFGSRQIIELTAQGHTLNNLFQLDDLDAWNNRFGGTYMSKDGTEIKVPINKVIMYAANALMQEAHRRGVFREENSVRGCGAWRDNGRAVLHCGDTLYVDGVRTGFGEMVSEYTYIAASPLMRPANLPLTNAEAHKLRRICEALTWENPLSGSLLAGWLVTAPICGALDYRPHIYITGEAESGKSTVLEQIIKPVLKKMAMATDGGTTEPAIRTMMGYDARPLIFDEAEPSHNMQNVIELARKASTGSTVNKYGQRPFKAQFSACFSAINPPVNKTADESRISFMVLKKNRAPNAMQQYEDLLAFIEESITPDYSERMIARTMMHMDTLIANIKVFQRAVRQLTGGARAAQQIGTMLAGLYLLSKTTVATADEAAKWVSQYDWTDHTIVDQMGDPERLVQHIASSLVRFGVSDTTIGELIREVCTFEEHSKQDKMLRNYGIAVKGDMVYIASRAQNLQRLLKDTEWGIKWSRTLGDVAGSVREKIVYFSAGIKTSAIGLPVAKFIETDYVPLKEREPNHIQEEIPYDPAF